MSQHPYTGACQDCGTAIPYPLLICFDCLGQRQLQTSRKNLGAALQAETNQTLLRELAKTVMVLVNATHGNPVPMGAYSKIDLGVIINAAENTDTGDGNTGE